MHDEILNLVSETHYVRIHGNSKGSEFWMNHTNTSTKQRTETQRQNKQQIDRKHQSSYQYCNLTGGTQYAV